MGLRLSCRRRVHLKWRHLKFAPEMFLCGRFLLFFPFFGGGGYGYHLTKGIGSHLKEPVIWVMPLIVNGNSPIRLWPYEGMNEHGPLRKLAMRKAELWYFLFSIMVAMLLTVITFIRHTFYRVRTAPWILACILGVFLLESAWIWDKGMEKPFIRC